MNIQKINSEYYYAQDLYRAADADLDTCEPIWRENGWGDAKIQETRKKVHELNKELFKKMGVSYGSSSLLKNL